MSDFITCDPKLAEHSPVLLNLFPRELLLHHLDWTYPVVNLVHKVLGEVSKLDVPVSHTSPLPGIHHLHDNLEKCRLTRTIFSNNTDRLHSCGQIDVGEDNSAFFVVSIGHLAQGENCPRHSFGIVPRKSHYEIGCRILVAGSVASLSWCDSIRSSCLGMCQSSCCECRWPPRPGTSGRERQR